MGTSEIGGWRPSSKTTRVHRCWRLEVRRMPTHATHIRKRCKHLPFPRRLTRDTSKALEGPWRGPWGTRNEDLSWLVRQAKLKQKRSVWTWLETIISDLHFEGNGEGMSALKHWSWNSELILLVSSRYSTFSMYESMYVSPFQLSLVMLRLR
jgi:hypothetical protein